MSKTIGDLFVYLDIYTSLLPIVFFFIFWGKSNKEKGLWVIIANCLLQFPINLLLLEENSNTFLYEIATVIEYVLFSAFIFLNIQRSSAKTALIIFGIAFISFLIPYVLSRAIKGIDSIPIGVETIIILTFSFYYLYERMNDTTTLFIYNTSQFWIVLGIVLYLAGSFFIYIFSGYSRAITKEYWFITNIFSIIKSIFFCIAIFIHAKPPKDGLNYSLDLSQLN